MEVNSSVSENYTDHKHHLSHPYSHHHHGKFPSKLAIIITISVVSILVVLAITLIIILLRRLKSAKTNGTDFDDEKGSLHNTSCRFIAQNSMNFMTSSPDVKGGCLQGGNLGRSMRAPMTMTTPTRYRGVQVLSYKELKEATDKFSEANVIGHGGFEVVYRGVLRDGTMAAIKMLHREGRQGERAFRLEVSDFIY